MTRFSEFPSQTRFSHVLTVAVTAASVPALAHAQLAQKDAAVDDKDAPATISAEEMTGHPDRDVTLERDVEVTRGAMVINSDHAVYRQVENQIEASGHVRMQRFGDRYTGDELKLQIDTGVGYVLHPTYHLARNNAQGKAERIDFEAQDRARVTDGTYSTCEGPDPDWYLQAATLNLDTGTDTGVASSTILYFKGAPILAAPTMSFPLSDARKTGVLPPTFAQTSNGGLEVMVPYYFNIAPNRDLTVYPKVITQRGLQLGASGRYLSETYTGQTNIEALFNDQKTKTNRYAVSSVHTQTLLPGLTYAWNLSAASDDDYPNDFSHTITNASQRMLLRDMGLNYGGSFWTAGAHVSNYQVLQDPAAEITRPYDRLPQLTLQAGRQDVHGLDWNVASELTRFSWRADVPPTPANLDRVRGDRAFVNTSLSYPLIRPGYFVTPRIALDATTYRLNYPATSAPALSPTSLTRVVPTLSLDSGLVFERDTAFFGKPMTQTLEPRLFYVRTPFRDQSLYPNFDTAEADLSFAQLFTENRFVGHDRISDANQITAAVVSRYIEQSGAERMRFALGQRFYFSEQRVTLGAVSDQSRSDLLASVTAQLSPTLNVDTNLQYSQTLHSTNRANFGVRWQPAPKKVLNLMYRRDRLNNLEQFDVSGQWPMANRWYAVGRANYSLPDSKIVEGLLGMEYKADCWVFRTVGQRIPTATGKATSGIFFQLELNGLTRLGSNPLDALRTSVPGYQMVNQPGN